MVVVSHLFFFLWKKLVRGAAHMSRPSHYLELSISRQPLFYIAFLLIEIFFSKWFAFLSSGKNGFSFFFLILFSHFHSYWLPLPLFFPADIDES